MYVVGSRQEVGILYHRSCASPVTAALQAAAAAARGHSAFACVNPPVLRSPMQHTLTNTLTHAHTYNKTQHISVQSIVVVYYTLVRPNRVLRWQRLLLPSADELRHVLILNVLQLFFLFCFAWNKVRERARSAMYARRRTPVISRAVRREVPAIERNVLMYISPSHYLSSELGRALPKST